MLPAARTKTFPRLLRLRLTPPLKLPELKQRLLGTKGEEKELTGQTLRSSFKFQ